MLTCQFKERRVQRGRFKYHQLIFALPQETSGQVQRTGRTDIPVSAQSKTVDKDTAANTGEDHEGITRRSGDFQFSQMECRLGGIGINCIKGQLFQ